MRKARARDCAQVEWDDWLECTDPEYARGYLHPYPAELMRAWEFPAPSRAKEVKMEMWTHEAQMQLL